MNDYISRLREIRAKMEMQIITRDEAKAEAQPIIDEMNERAEKVAKQFGKKHKKFTFIGLMR